MKAKPQLYSDKTGVFKFVKNGQKFPLFHCVILGCLETIRERNMVKCDRVRNLRSNAPYVNAATTWVYKPTNENGVLCHKMKWHKTHLVSVTFLKCHFGINIRGKTHFSLIHPWRTQTEAAQMDDANWWRSYFHILFSIYIIALWFTMHSSHNLTCLKLISHSLTKILLEPSHTVWHAINLKDCCYRTV